MIARAYFVRAVRAGSDELVVRTPELAPLREKTVAVFGVGCLGAACALELARAGVARLRLLDHDYVDPMTSVRWPLGFAAAGEPKVSALQAFIHANYPWTEVIPFGHRLGSTAMAGTVGGGLSDAAAVGRMTDGASLVIDATAEIGVQQFLAADAAARALPYLGVSAAPGGWGGKVFRSRPADPTRGCWHCYRLALEDGTIPPPPNRPDDGVQPAGCGDLTFTGANFDMQTVTMTAVRFAVATLCEGVEGGYPPLPWDVMTIALRDGTGVPIVPEFKGYVLARHPDCATCNGF